MAKRQSTLPVYDRHSDNDEPEQEDIGRNSIQSEDGSFPIVKPLLRPAMRHRPITELVYPWVPTDSNTFSVINESAMVLASSLHHTKGCLGPGPRARDGVTTALWAGNSRTFDHNVHTGAEPQGYGSMRHSILRMSASKTSIGNGLKKSSSVEFVLDHVHHQTAQGIYASTSSIGREPRRLTGEEKAELYRSRPDLEIGLDSYPSGQTEDLYRRNQQRVIFALFGGFISIILMLVFFSMWERSS